MLTSSVFLNLGVRGPLSETLMPHWTRTELLFQTGGYELGTIAVRHTKADSERKRNETEQ